MCPLRAPSGRWKPTSTSCMQYGKVYKHMALNRDVSGFSLNVPPTCRIWLKCNEVLVRGGRWLSWPDSHYCLVIGCQAADATLRYIPSMPKGMSWNRDCAWQNIWKISKSKQATVHYKHWIWILILFHVFFPHMQLVALRQGHCAPLYLLKAAWCDMNRSNSFSVQKLGNWLWNMTL